MRGTDSKMASSKMVDRLVMPKRPHSYPGETISVKTGCGTIFGTVSVDETGYPIEVFGRGKGGCMSVSLEALGKATAVGLRCGVDAQEFIDQYKRMFGGIIVPNATGKLIVPN